MSVDPPQVSRQFRQKLGAEFTFLSDEKGELLDLLNVRHRKGHRQGDIAFPTGVLVDKYGVVRWVYEAEFGHMRLTPQDLFSAMEQLTLEEQNRELRLGKAVGKVVRQVFLMKRPEDLASAIEVMRDELRRLGLAFSVCGINIVDEAAGTLQMMSAAPTERTGDAASGMGRLASVALRLSDIPETAEIVDVWKKKSVGVLLLEPGSHPSSFRELAARHACDRLPDADLRFLLNVPFSHGTVFIGGSHADGPSEDDVRTLTEFAEAIGVAYQRFADFQRLEKRTHELQETQLQLVQSAKMASLGQLVAGVAHELNTPMGAIHSNTQSEKKTLDRIHDLLGSASPDLSALGELEATMVRLREMNAVNETACRRIIQIVSNLRKFARLDESEWKRVDLREGIDDTLALVEHQTRGKVEIVRSYDDIPLVGCYPSQLNQVFMNLIVNAIQAVDGRGRIAIECFREGAVVKVRVRDNGHGISAEALARVFDPGYTTKGVGVGTGLGLSIAYRIVSYHGGTLSVESEVGKGSAFTVSIPVDASKPAQATTTDAYTHAMRS